MIDHEPFLVLGTRAMHEPLTAAETDRLEQHLATCSSCRTRLAALRADDARVRGLLAAAPVSPRVHDRVLKAARGGRHVSRRLVFAAVAALVIVALAGTAVGGRFGLGPSPSPSLSPVPIVTPVPSPSATPSPTPRLSPSPSILGSVNGAYAYSVKPGATRRDSVSATLAPGPSGEWSRLLIPADGSRASAGGLVTCLVIDGSEAWMAGPATTASDGSTDRAAFLYVRDGGPGGADDMVVLWMNDPGQTLATMEGWCTSRFIPAGPYPVEDGDVTVEDGTR